MLRKLSSHIQPFEFERLSAVDNLTIDWGRAAHIIARPATEDLPTLDLSLIRAVSRALASSFYQQEHENFREEEVDFPQAHKEARQRIIYFTNFCYQEFEDTESEKLNKRYDVTIRLEKAVKARNEAAFSDILKEVDWREIEAVEFIRIIDLALEIGTHLAARQIATKGAEAYPDNAELQKYARVLAPPKVVANRVSRNINQKANVEWLKANKNDYKGQWVAIKDGILLAAANSYKDLRDQIGETKGKGILVTTVY